MLDIGWRKVISEAIGRFAAMPQISHGMLQQADCGVYAQQFSTTISGVTSFYGHAARNVDERQSSIERLYDRLGVARGTIDRWMKRRGLTAHRVSRLGKFKVPEMDERIRIQNADRLETPRSQTCKLGQDEANA